MQTISDIITELVELGRDQRPSVAAGRLGGKRLTELRQATKPGRGHRTVELVGLSTRSARIYIQIYRGFQSPEEAVEQGGASIRGCLRALGVKSQ